MVSFFARRGFLCVLCAEESFEHIQTVGPEALVEAQPLVGAGERSGGEATQMSAPAYLAMDQSGVLQCLNVFGGGRERHREGFSKLAYRSLTAGQFAKHPPAGGVAQGAKDCIQLRWLQFNHMVEYKSAPSKSQPIG